jgi:hypothetical protein
MDLTQSIEPKSDQMNAEDLLSGPRTFTITEVSQGSSEQPVNVYLAEFPHDRPFKPSKTVRRLMVTAWGPDAATYTGKRITLYRDPAVKFGGMDVGGIRISHMTGIDKPLRVALSVTRGKRAMYVVQPLADEPAKTAEPHGMSPAERKMFALLKKSKREDKQQALDFLSQTVDRTITSRTDLTPAELSTVIKALEAETEGATP